MIRWIVEGRLGTSPGDALPSDPAILILDTRAMVDKRGNSRNEIHSRIQAGVDELRRDGCVVVVCDFGVSRSNTIAAGILAEWRGIPVDDAVAYVVAATGEHAIKLDMVDSLRDTLSPKPAPISQDGLLITGGGGFIGNHLRSKLADRHRVMSPDRSALDLLGPVVNLERFCRENGVGKIVHLAFPRIYTNNSAMGQSLTMLRGILDVCKSLGIHLFLPSGAVVFSAYQTSAMVADVNTSPRPRGVYGETKHLEEVLIHNARINGEIEATIMRVSPTYGPGSSRPRLIDFAHRQLLAGAPVITHRYRNGLPSLQLLYVDDAVDGMASIIESAVASRTYHLGGMSSFEPREIAQGIGEILGLPARIDEVHIDDDVSNVFLDWSVAEKELGWSPTTPLRDGLRRTLARSVHASNTDRDR